MSRTAPAVLGLLAACGGAEGAGGLFFGTYDPAAIVAGTLQADWVKVFTAK